MAMIPFAVLMALVLIALRVFWASPELHALLPAPYNAAVLQGLDLVLVLVAAYLADRLFRRLYWRNYLHLQRGHEAPALMRDLVTLVVFALAISLWLYFELGVAASGLIAASGATAVVVGLALQTMILDLFSGLSVNFDHSFVIGDWLTVHAEGAGPMYGKVEGMTWRTTVLRLEDGRCVVIPNRLMTAHPVTNHTRPPTPKRHSVEVTLDLRAPSERVLRLLRGEAHKAVRAEGLSPYPEPSVVLARLVNDAASYDVRFYAYPDKLSPSEACSIVLRALQDALRVHGLPMPSHRIEIAPSEGAVAEPSEVRAAIERVPLFARVLSPELLDELAERCWPVTFEAGSVILQQGDAGSSMFIVLDGAARVTVSGTPSGERELAVLASGDFLGEMSLLTGTPRTATVTAVTALQAVEITKETMEAVFATAPDLLERFGAVLAERQTHLDRMASRSEDHAAVERDLVTRMRTFFSRTFAFAPHR